MVALTFDARRRLLGGLLVWGILSVLAGPIVGGPRADGLVQRQQLPNTQSAVSTATGLPATTPTQVSRTRTASASASTAAVTTRTTISAASVSGTSTQSATSTSAAPTATATIEPSIFSSSSKYFGYAIGVLVVVCVFGFLLFVLFIRFIVQLFSKKPQPPPVNTTTNRAWRYSRDSDLDSGEPIPTSAHPTTRSDLGPRHKDLDTSEMGERRTFLSTDSVTLYPVPKFETESDRYDSDSGRMRSFSSSSGSGTITAPFVSRRPVSMSFLHSPPATHPAFIVDPGSQSGHSHEGDVESTPRPQPHLLQAVPEARTTTDVNTNSLLLARASHSDAYRQQTRSSTGLSRAASTASAYSTQPPSSIPPVPELPPAWMLSGRGFEPDVANAVTTMRGRNGSVDSVYMPQGTTAPPTDEGHTATRRMMPGQAGWGRQASVHGDGFYFDQR
ncbi:hypothetical protein BDV93DRAFT_527867 [Ceratobasidium sp. AG-I]|nr:hypothetical protein BDV93DRAFT_527867 [Ceratobasidium sp. AG-I]